MVLDSNILYAIDMAHELDPERAQFFSSKILDNVNNESIRITPDVVNTIVSLGDLAHIDYFLRCYPEFFFVTSLCVAAASNREDILCFLVSRGLKLTDDVVSYATTDELETKITNAMQCDDAKDASALFAQYVEFDPIILFHSMQNPLEVPCVSRKLVF